VRDLQDLAASAEAAQVDQALEAIMNTQPIESKVESEQLASFCKTAAPQSTTMPKIGRNAPCPNAVRPFPHNDDAKTDANGRHCCIGKAA
jgi:hypothetical protein